LYHVTNLVKDQPHHIPKGAFARMITFKEDINSKNLIEQS